MSAITTAELERVIQLPDGERAVQLTALGGQLLCWLDGGEAPENGLQQRLIAALLALVESGRGEPEERVTLGEVLGRLGDPRLRMPEDEDYWGRTPQLDGGSLSVGRFPVTMAEFRRFAAAGCYEDRAYWSDDGWAWLQVADAIWPAVAREELEERWLVDNQPVVGVTWYEAMAYAVFSGARLPTFQERMGVVRGSAKRPYPWGEPFGHGNANTREEVLNRPCAVGLYRRDCTPEGIFDLAGNVAEWVADEVDGKCVIAPGAWSQESLSSWAKARSLQQPGCRGTDLGLRLARG